jgi:hypothetical protein
MLGCYVPRVLRALVSCGALTTALGVTAVGAGAISTYIAIGYFHYERIALDERLAAERATLANADLQEALDQMQAELVALQIALNALNKEVAAAEARNKASGELERQLAAYEEAMARQTGSVQRRQPPSRRARRRVVALVRPTAIPVAQPSPLPVASIAPGVDAARSKNFTSPAWVPSYFSSESAPFLGGVKSSITGSPGV